MIRAIVVMGISGSGKSTLGSRLASAIDFQFVEGDSLHPSANVAKMSAGVALSDEDRWPWLERVAASLSELATITGCVIACSALKRSYRDFIRSRVQEDVLFVFPIVDHDVLRERLTRRAGHYMPLSLLESQIATLETPQPDEAVLCVDGMASVEDLTAELVAFLQARDGLRSPRHASP
jgi:gluconokinase